MSRIRELVKYWCELSTEEELRRSVHCWCGEEIE